MHMTPSPDITESCFPVRDMIPTCIWPSETSACVRVARGSSFGLGVWRKASEFLHSLSTLAGNLIEDQILVEKKPLTQTS